MIVSNPYKEEAIAGAIKSLKETNSCTVVAFCKVFDTTYQLAHQFLKQHGRQSRKGLTLTQLEEVFSAVKKSKVKKGPYSSINRITISEFVKKHNKGRYFAVVRGHAIAIVDGVVYDHSDKPRRQIQAAWRVYLPDKTKENLNACRTSV